MIVYVVVAIEEIYGEEYERNLSYFRNKKSAENHVVILKQTVKDPPYGGYIIKEVRVQ